MIGALRGNIHSTQEDSLILDVNGVGYELMPTSSILNADITPGTPLELVVFTDVKETSITLYGFENKLEREVFLLLKKVKGIGPKLALCIVSTLTAEGVLAGIAHGDLGVFQRVSGVGKRTAERLIVELREQVGDYVGAADLSSRVETTRTPSAEADVMLALEKLGFSEEKARAAVDKTFSIVSAPETMDASELLRQALSQLSVQ